jgi:hypothetical protein
MANSVERTVFDLLPTGMNQEGFEVDRMAQRIKAAGPGGMSRSELTRAFQHIKPRDREDRLKTLQEAEDIRVLRKTTAGRPAEIFVHKDFWSSGDAGD